MSDNRQMSVAMQRLIDFISPPPPKRKYIFFSNSTSIYTHGKMTFRTDIFPHILLLYYIIAKFLFHRYISFILSD
jgi:hypothetical protein